MPRNIMKIANVAGCLATIFILTAAGVSSAQDGAPSAEDLEAAKSAYKEGEQAFHKNKFKEAVAAFKESYRLSKNPVLLYNIGYALESAGDAKLALFYYKKFLSDTPKDASNRDLAKGRAEDLSRELAEGTDADPDAGDKGDGDKGDGDRGDSGDKGEGNKGESGEKGEKGDPSSFEHNVIDEVPPGKPVDITAFAPQNVGWKVYLNYRAPGAAKFTTVEMQPRYRELVGRIPASVVRGSSLQYYVEARDIGDEMVARSGKSSSPHVMLIENSAKARYYPDWDGGDAGETPLDLEGGGTAVGGRDSGPSDRMTYAKWGATGAALGFVALSATFLAVAADASSSLEGAAVSSSQQATCPEGRPCDPFSDSERSLQSRGKRFETLGNVFLGAGLAAGAAAGVLWYLESKKAKKGDASVVTTPALGPNFVGAAATVRF